MTNNEVRNHLIFFTQNVVNLQNRDLYAKIDEHFERSVFLNNVDWLERNSFIEDNNLNSTYSITGKGQKFLSQLIKEDEYCVEKERIEFEKSKIDLVLAQKMLKEYPYTKWLAIIGAVIGILLGLKELSILIKKYLLL